jgi:MFS family permease
LSTDPAEPPIAQARPWLATQGWRAPFQGYDRRLWILFACFIVSSMGFAMVVPFISLYFHEKLGVPMSQVGLFFLGSAVVRAIFQGYAGDLSDRLGRVKLMSAGQAALSAVYAAMAFAVFRGWGFLAAASILVGSYAAGAFFQPVASAAVSDLVGRERRLDAYSLMRVANNLGWGIGPMVGGFVARVGYGWLFVIGCGTSLTTSILVRRFLPETRRTRGALNPLEQREAGFAEGATSDEDRPERDAERSMRSRGAGWRDFLEIRKDRRFLLFAGLILLVFITMSQWLATLSVYAADHLGISTTQLGFMFGINGFMVVVFQVPVTRALRFLSLVGALALGSLVYSASFFSLAFAGAYGHLVAGMVAITVAELIVSPPSVALVSLIAPPEYTGRYMGIYSLTTSFGWSVGPFIGGVLLDAWMNRPVLLWGAVAAFSTVAAAGFLRYRKLYPSGR